MCSVASECICVYGACVISRNTYIKISLFPFSDFSHFQRCYHLLYQSFPPDPRRSLAVIMKRYSVPKDFEVQIQHQSTCRISNQSILNYMLIELRRDRNLSQFWDTVKMMVEDGELMKAVEKCRLQQQC